MNPPKSDIEDILSEIIQNTQKKTVRMKFLSSRLSSTPHLTAEALLLYAKDSAPKRFIVSKCGFESLSDNYDYEIEIQKNA